MSTERSKFTIKLGNFERTYVYLKTKAPAAYDHGGVIEIRNDLNIAVADEDLHRRYILVPEEAVEWQIGRNRSGLYVTEFEEVDEWMARSLSQELMGWIRSGTAMEGALINIDQFWSKGDAPISPGALIGPNDEMTARDMVSNALRKMHE